MPPIIGTGLCKQVICPSVIFSSGSKKTENPFQPLKTKYQGAIESKLHTCMLRPYDSPGSLDFSSHIPFPCLHHALIPLPLPHPTKANRTTDLHTTRRRCARGSNTFAPLPHFPKQPNPPPPPPLHPPPFSQPPGSIYLLTHSLSIPPFPIDPFHSHPF
jgi:hypothetical protein